VKGTAPLLAQLLGIVALGLRLEHYGWCGSELKLTGFTQHSQVGLEQFDRKALRRPLMRRV
jgi:hypothetical protein